MYPWPKARGALISLNVLSVSDRQVSFRHQGLLDHLVAERVLRLVHTNNASVAEWLIRVDQSLFRRDQLRQVLTLLRDEDHVEYIRTINDVLSSNDIRFHLKHLVLGLLGAVESPSDAEADLVLELLGQPVWRKHVVNRVLWGSPAWFLAINGRGLIRTWLDSGNDKDVDLAFTIMRAICPKCGQVWGAE